MKVAERGGRRWPVLLALSILILASRATAQSSSVPARVEMVLVGSARADFELGERIRTLFDPATTLELRVQPALSTVEVLEPARSDTVYVFVTLSEGTRASIYVATREADDRGARYLLRDVELESGLDEIGAETVAQVVHSSAMALYSRAAQTSEDAVAGELAREERRTRENAAVTVQAKPKRVPPASPVPPQTREGGKVRLIAPRFGAELALHRSGDEGWLVSPGLHVGAVALETWGLRLQAGYVLPSRFQVPPAFVSLSGFAVEARASAFAFRAPDLRFRVDAGGGVLRVRWEAEDILTDEGDAWSLRSERESRGYVVAGIAAELPVGSLLNAAFRAEIRLLTTPAHYDVVTDGRRETRAEVAMAPGLAFELSLPPLESESEPRAR